VGHRGIARGKDAPAGPRPTLWASERRIDLWRMSCPCLNPRNRSRQAGCRREPRHPIAAFLIGAARKEGALAELPCHLGMAIVHVVNDLAIVHIRALPPPTSLNHSFSIDKAPAFTDPPRLAWRNESGRAQRRRDHAKPDHWPWTVKRDGSEGFATSKAGCFGKGLFEGAVSAGRWRGWCRSG